MMVIPRPVIRQALESNWPVKLFPSDIGYFPDAQGHRVDRPSGAPELILILCQKGTGWATIQGQNYKVSPGQLLVIPPGTPHSYGADAAHPWSIYWLHAAGPVAYSLAQKLMLHPRWPVMSASDSFRITSLFDELMAELAHGYGYTSLTTGAGILIHLLAIVCSQPVSAAHESDSHDRVSQVVRYMHQSWKGHIKVPALARQCNLSISHFCELFKNKTGFPPLDYFLRIKIQRACELLATTQLSIKQISLEIGMSDPLYFSRVFTRIHGVPPSSYRKAMRS